ncbi:MAG: selenide, water dikinase SelD [Alphaproteobacteria bacterium]|nr:selenide, water dikinase SelD [Alphaproteobacteria bacterium]
MRKNAQPVRKDLVLLGGGHAHAGVIRAFAMQPEDGVRLTLVSRDIHTPYSGMLPGLIAGHYEFDDAHIDLNALARFAGARFVNATANGIDPAGQRIIFADRPPLPFDILSVDIGSSPSAAHIPGALEHATSVKPISAVLEKWNALLARLTQHDQSASIAVVGAGAAGVEVLLAVQWRLEHLRREKRFVSPLQFNLVSNAADILPAFPAGVRRRFEAILDQRKIFIHRNAPVMRVEPHGVHTPSGFLAADEIIWVTAAAPAPWLQNTGLALDAAGFIAVNDELQSLSHKNIFAAGDIASMVNHPRPKAGVFAVRQTAPLAKNLRHALRGESLVAFKPQSQFLTLISTGGKHAVAARNGISLQGEWVWRWKDRIDRKFMNMFNQLPSMPESSEDPMRCYGCAAKIDGASLARTLDALQSDKIGAASASDQHDDAAIIDRGDHYELQTVDFFPAPFSDPFLFGQAAARHALGDIEAMGGKAETALAIATVPFAQGTKMGETLEQMMAGAMKILESEGVELRGGHSGEGEQLALGFSITGRADKPQLIRKGGLQRNDILILTKPVGTGVLFAADMRARAKGRWIEAAIQSMLKSNARAVHVFREHDAHAMTDVTGFGLAGHLAEMLHASRCAAEIETAALPVLAGARECFAQGIRSTAHDGNMAYAGSLLKDTGDPLLFDPQTAGGLLAGVAEHQATAALTALHAAGYKAAAVIGRVTASDVAPAITLRRISMQEM